MADKRHLARAEIYIAEGRILNLVADGMPVEDTLDGLARTVGVSSDDLRACLREMVAAGWIAVQTRPFGRLTLRLELRTLGPRTVRPDRRRHEPDAWPL
jgi:hypothetical protein